VAAPEPGPFSVLEASPPRFSPAEAATIAADVFHLRGTAISVGSERDQTFLIEGDGGGVLKISNRGEDPATLDLETRAVLHVASVDPAIPVARPRIAPHGGAGLSAYRPVVEGSDGAHFVRLFQRMYGRVGGPELDEGAVFAYGAMHARLNLALRAFFDPAARRDLLWNLEHAARLRPLVHAISDTGRRRLVESVLDRYEQRVLPRWTRLRAQVLHGDFNLDNVLLDEHDRIAGIVDFGDTGYTAQAADFAVGLASLLRGRADADVSRIARIAIDGYASRIPFEQQELDLLADLVATRLATIVTISAWRVERYPENADYIQAWDADSWKLLELFDATGADAVARQFGGTQQPAPTDELARRRHSSLGSALTDLSYRDPVHVVRAEGVWLFDAQGRRLLDAYNNVPVAGHCHPRVTEAIVRQTRAVNTHSRYLYEPLIELAERLAASMPRDAGLDAVMIVNSGSEANDLAWRVATTTTGRRGAIVTEHAYHGVTSAIADLSPEEWPEGFRPPNVETIAPPGSSARTDREIARAVERLHDRGVGLAATFIDSAFTSDGIRTPPRAEVVAIARETQGAGGLLVADEVQAGHGRNGEHLWAFTQYGITPDVVTLGKPMGNGYPVAAMITRKEIFDRFARSTRVFSTFGGNPVAARAALAVLDVIEDERLIDNAARVGSRLLGSLDSLRAPHTCIADVRGGGLLVGVELVTAAPERAPDPHLAERVVNRLRDGGVLIGRTGRHGNVLKIRPPLVFTNDNADVVVDSLADALAVIGV
jgi:4-aminobutyrate aminotransferase-like enzyme/Ser/Thr protein kinase RdoA (MazF antagonist)